MPVTSARFPRSARLLTQSEYRRVFKKPCRSTDSWFSVFACVNHVGKARLGLAISKKQLRRAVDRNRIKRLVRESFRHNLGTLPGLDIVVVGRSGLSRASTDQILASLGNHWRKLGSRCRSC